MILITTNFFPRIELPILVYLLVVLVLGFGPILFLFYHEYERYQAAKTEPKGCRKLGLRTQSNLRDEFDKKYSEGSKSGKDSSEPNWKVKSLWIFPLKSCRGIELNRGEVVSTGLKYDRQFSFATWEDGSPKNREGWKFLTQRQLPKMALVTTEIWIPDPSSPQYSVKKEDVKNGGMLVVKFPSQRKHWRNKIISLVGLISMESFSVPLAPTTGYSERMGYKTEAFTIWKDTPPALNMGLSVPAALKDFLGISKPLTLFKVDIMNHREVFRCAPRKETLGYQPIVGFADAYPLQILSITSVQNLAEEIRKKHETDVDLYKKQLKAGTAPSRGPPRLPPQDLSAIRFRANIIISGMSAFEEETWKLVRIGKNTYHITCRCVRCKLPNVDPGTGVMHVNEPDYTLRHKRNVDKGEAARNLGCLGVQAVPNDQGRSELERLNTLCLANPVLQRHKYVWATRSKSSNEAS